MAVNWNGGADRISFSGLNGGATPNMASWLHVRFKTSQVPTTGIILGARWDGGSRNGFAVHITSSPLGQLILEAWNATTNRVSLSSGVTVNDGNWHSALVLASSGTGATNLMYLDGSLVDSDTSAGTWATQDHLILSWGSLGFWNALVGDLADVAVWNDTETWSAADALALSKGYSPSIIHPNALVLHVPLVRSLVDRYGNTQAFLSGTTVANHPLRLGGIT